MGVVAFLLGVVILVVYMGIWYTIGCELIASVSEMVCNKLSAGIIV